jgi:menaquinone-dependent protoporphyrinogen oxidase
MSRWSSGPAFTWVRCAKKSRISAPGTWRPERLGLFICCLYDGVEAQKELETAFPAELLDSAVVKAHLGGKVDPGELNFLERLATRVVAKVKEKFDQYSEADVRGFARALQAGQDQ